MVERFLQDWVDRGLQNPDLQKWLERFQQDKRQAAWEFWEEVRAGIEEAFMAGAETIPDILPPYRAARLDIMEQKKPSS
jgi:hypothetical protein